MEKTEARRTYMPYRWNSKKKVSCAKEVVDHIVLILLSISQAVEAWPFSAIIVESH